MEGMSRMKQKVEIITHQKPFQDYYSDWGGRCYGCGPYNELGLQIKSYWDDDESVCYYTPKPYHTSVAGFVYGGLLASLIDCHSTATAAAAAYRKAQRPMDSLPELRFVTASLHVDYLKPTPIDGEMVLRGTIEEISERKVVVATVLMVEDRLCAKGRVIAVKAPENMRGGPRV
jgi:acyl-coenzyme A thioesterase PaaI-like protein